MKTIIHFLTLLAFFSVIFMSCQDEDVITNENVETDNIPNVEEQLTSMINIYQLEGKVSYKILDQNSTLSQEELHSLESFFSMIVSAPSTQIKTRGREQDEFGDGYWTGIRYARNAGYVLQVAVTWFNSIHGDDGSLVSCNIVSPIEDIVYTDMGELEYDLGLDGSNNITDILFKQNGALQKKGTSYIVEVYTILDGVIDIEQKYGNVDFTVIYP